MRIKTELKRRLQEFTGIGPTAADIFCVMPAARAALIRSAPRTGPVPPAVMAAG